MDHPEFLDDRHIRILNAYRNGDSDGGVMPIKTWPEFKTAWHKVIRRWPDRSFWKNLKKLSNLIDDYPDWVKEKIHGANLPFGREINISVLMANRHPKTWDIIRKQGDYANSDPEDRSDYDADK